MAYVQAAVYNTTIFSTFDTYSYNKTHFIIIFFTARLIESAIETEYIIDQPKEKQIRL